MSNETKEMLILQLDLAICELNKKGIAYSGNTNALNWSIRKGQITKLTYYIPDELNTEGNITINPHFGQISHQLTFRDPFLHVFKINYYIDLDYFSIDNDEVDNESGSITSRITVDNGGQVVFIQKKDSKMPCEYTIYKKTITFTGEEKIIIYRFYKSDLPDDVDQLLWTVEIVNNNKTFEYPNLPNNAGKCVINVLEGKTTCTIIDQNQVKTEISIDQLHQLYPEVYRAYFVNEPEVNTNQTDNKIKQSITDVIDCPIPLINEQLALKIKQIKKHAGRYLATTPNN